MIVISSSLIAGVLLGIATGLGGSIPDEEGIRKAMLYSFTPIVITLIGGGIYLYNRAELEVLFEFIASFVVGFIVAFLSGLRYRKWRHGIPVAVLD